MKTTLKVLAATALGLLLVPAVGMVAAAASVGLLTLTGVGCAAVGLAAAGGCLLGIVETVRG
jgi:hypothetical protein